MDPPQLPSNALHPEDSRAWVTIAVVAFVLTVASAAVGLRVYTRAVVLKQFGMDDYAAIASFAIIFGCGFSVACLTAYGGGKHIFFLTQDQISLYFRTFYVSIIFYSAGLFSIKLTFLLQYWRILTGHTYRNIFIICTLLVLGWSLSQVFVSIFQCIPIQKFWEQETPGRCIPFYPFFYINAAGNIFTDIVIFILPLPLIGRLQLPKIQKLILIGIFCLGFFTVSISVIRIRFLKIGSNPTWENVVTSGWSIGELCCGITCACIPTLRPLIKHWKLPLMSSITNHTGYARQLDTGVSADRLPPSQKRNLSQRYNELSRSEIALNGTGYELSFNAYRPSPLQHGHNPYTGRDGIDSG